MGDLDFSHSALLFSSCALLLHCWLFFSFLFLNCSRTVVLHLLFSVMRHTCQSPTVYSVESVFLCVLDINSTNAGEATLEPPVNLVYFRTLLRAGLEIIFSVSWMRCETSNTLQTVVLSFFYFFPLLSLLKPFSKVLTEAGSTH